MQENNFNFEYDHLKNKFCIYSLPAEFNPSNPSESLCSGGQVPPDTFADIIAN